MRNKLLGIAMVLIIISCKPYSKFPSANIKKPNILFIAIDDLRPELGCYGSPIAQTPNIDALASQGLRFNKAYCQQAICSPSRASLMTGARPETIQVIENYTYFRDKNPDIITLPQHFKENGYETVYCGKVYHANYTDDEKSWSRSPSEDKVAYNKPKLTGGYALPENIAIFKSEQAAIKAKYGNVDHYALGRGPAFENADVPDQAYPDGYNAEVAMATMKDLKSSGDSPFFLAVGFKLPHLDWIAPKKYWDLYDPTKIPLAENVLAPQDGAKMGLHASFELRTRFGIPKSGPIDDAMARTLKHAYLASVSYVDAQIGKIIKALDDSGQRENTIIILWSDHGYHLGEMGVWAKATNYEVATKVPLIISVPGMSKNVIGTSSEALVELVDMYPTLAELAGLSLPSHLEGLSFVPLLSKPMKKWKSAAFSQYPDPALREWAANPLTKGMRETYFGPLMEEVEAKIIEQQKEKWDRDLFENYLMGYAMRTERYRLVVWKDRRYPKATPIFIELYDHRVDPQESKNIAQSNPHLVNSLLKQFDKGWKGNLPM